MRYKCTCSYDGTLFHGFQVQPNLRSVQEEIETVLEIICKKKTIIYASGRTDALVHATGQVFHFDTEIVMKEWQMKNAINSRLPRDIYVTNVEIVNDDFHARFDVVKKEYHYLINTNEFNPLQKNYMYFVMHRKYDFDKIEDASKVFIGTHDFKSFTKNHDDIDTTRTIYDIIFEEKDGIITIKFIGNGFLYNMVRIIVGMLLEVGLGKYTKNDLKYILEQKNRQLCPKIAPPNGLYLYKVYYE